MSRTVKLECSHPGPDYRLELSDDERLEPGPHEVIVRVRACSVNPIDVKRAGGYGRRLLSLKGAYGSQLVLGNDFSGVVVRIGADVKGIQPGRSVFGCVPTTARGSHAGVVKVDAAQVQLLPHGVAHEQACVLPYTFSTLWQALKALGLNEVTAKGRTVLILGASGALGTLATQVLSHWGAAVTAVARSSQAAACLRAGAVRVVDREAGGLTRLGPSFDVTLNFADWAQDQALIRCLNVGAIGHATTVHPLMANFDNLGWLRGALRTLAQWWQHSRAVKAASPGAAYSWVLYKPDPVAMKALGALLEGGVVSLPVERALPFADARQAFDHVGAGGGGRIVLTPP